MLARIDSAELTDWMAYYRIDPWGGERGDLQAGIVASMVGNVNLKDGAEPLGPSDFALTFGPKPLKIATAKEIAAKLVGLTLSRGGEVK